MSTNQAPAYVSHITAIYKEIHAMAQLMEDYQNVKDELEQLKRQHSKARKKRLKRANHLKSVK